MNERWVRLALRAYPRRLRAAKGAEVHGAVADAADAGDAAFIDARSLVGLIVAGWMVRWRAHPPPLPWVRYLLGRDVMDRRWHGWLLDELDGWSVERRGWAQSSLWLAWLMGLAVATQQPIPDWTLMFAVGAPLLAGRVPAMQRRRRVTVLRANGFDSQTRQWLAPARPLVPSRRARQTRAGALLSPLGAAFTVALIVHVLWWWVPGLRLEGADAGFVAIGRVVDAPIAIAGRLAVLVALGLSVVFATLASRLHGWLRVAPDVARATKAELVVNTLAALALAVLPLLPVMPLAVPLVMPPVLATGPMLLLLGRRALRMERDGSGVVLARPVRARPETATRP
ncbi:MAG: hypothetical protein ABMA25_06505 [Ilumatobacteraceae bacterium]